MIKNPGSFAEWRRDRYWQSEKEAIASWEQACLDYLQQQKRMEKAKSKANVADSPSRL